jgi:heme exporter protein D
MDAVHRFLDMGGYARFIWPAYGLAVIVLGGFLVTSIAAYRRTKRDLAALDAQRGGRRR